MKTKQKILEKHLGSSISYYTGCIHGGVKDVEDAMDEYAELVMKQANDAERSSDKCHIQNVIARLSIKEIEAMVQLLHSDDWEYGNSEERCEELKEKTRNKIGYSKSDLAAL